MEAAGGLARIALVGPGTDQPCGIGDYVRRLEGALAARCRLVRVSYREALSEPALDGCGAVLVHYERSLVPGPGYLRALADRHPGRVFVAPHEVYREDPYAFPYAGIRSGFPPLLWLKRLRYRWRHRRYAAEQSLQRAGYHAHRVLPLSREGGEILKSMAATPGIAARILPAVPVARVDPPSAAPSRAGTAAGGGAEAAGGALFPGHRGAVAGIFGFLNPGLDYGAAFDLAEAMRPGLALALIGGDRAGYPMSRALGGEIRRRGLADLARITGYLPEASLAASLARCDFFLCPMRFKSSSASVLQLFGQGKPILVPDLPLTRYLAGEGAPVTLYAGSEDLLAKASAAAEGRLAAPPDRYRWDIGAVAEAYLGAMAAAARG